MILCVGIETNKNGEWKNVLESSYTPNQELGLDMMDIPQTVVDLEQGESLSFYSILSPCDSKLVLGVDQAGGKLVELTCTSDLDLVLSTKKGMNVRFYTKA